MSDARDPRRRDGAEPEADEKNKKEREEARADAKLSASRDGQRPSHGEAARAYRLTTKGRDRERKRIGRELHDGLLHSLITIKFALERLVGEVSSDDRDGHIADALQDVAHQVRNCIDEVRAVASDLLPPRLDDVEYIDALNQCIDAFGMRHPARIHRRLHGPQQPLTPLQKLNLFRILQEALNNVAKHSDATRIDIELQQVETRLQLRISDNGRGFAHSAGDRRGHGLSSMRSRAVALGGSLSIQPGLESGIHVSVEIPLTEG